MGLSWSTPTETREELFLRLIQEKETYFSWLRPSFWQENLLGYIIGPSFNRPLQNDLLLDFYHYPKTFTVSPRGQIVLSRGPYYHIIIEATGQQSCYHTSIDFFPSSDQLAYCPSREMWVLDWTTDDPKYLPLPQYYLLNDRFVRRGVSAAPRLLDERALPQQLVGETLSIWDFPVGSRFSSDRELDLDRSNWIRQQIHQYYIPRPEEMYPSLFLTPEGHVLITTCDPLMSQTSLRLYHRSGSLLMLRQWPEVILHVGSTGYLYYYRAGLGIWVAWPDES